MDELGAVIPIADLQATHPGWVVERAGRAVRYFADEQKIFAYLQKCRMTMRIAPILLELAATHPASKHASMDERVRDLGKWASAVSDEISPREIAMFTAHSFVSRWNIVETALEDSLVAIVYTSPAAQQLASSNGLKLPAGAATDRVQGRVRGWVSDKRTVGSSCGAWLAAFKLIQVHIELPQPIQSQITEAKAVRNCLVHRHSTVDPMLLEQAPSCRWTLGEEIVLSLEDLDAYTTAMRELLVALVGALANSPYAPTAPSAEDARSLGSEIADPTPGDLI